MTLYIDKQEKQIDETVKYITVPYEIVDLKYGDYSNDEESFVVERKSWQDYYGSVLDGSLIAQCEKIRANFSGLAGVLFEGDFWAMIATIKSKGLKHKMVYTRYRITIMFGMFFQECYDKYELVKTLQFLNENGSKIIKDTIGFEKHHIKTKDKRVLALCSIPGIGPKLADQIIKVYRNIFNFLWEIVNDEESVMESLERFGPKILHNVIKMFILDEEYTNKVLTKEEINELRAFHAKKRVTYEKLKGKSHGS